MRKLTLLPHFKVVSLVAAVLLLPLLMFTLVLLLDFFGCCYIQTSLAKLYSQGNLSLDT